MLAPLLATMHRLPMPLRAGARRPALRSRWWQTCIAWCALVALAWPSLGPLPYLVHDFGAHHDSVDAHAHADGGGAHRSGNLAHSAGDDDDEHPIDVSAIPGSPTHPADHDCPECLVLKHLARCVLPVLAITLCAPARVAIGSPPVEIGRPRTQASAHLPPARAPPVAVG